MSASFKTASFALISAMLATAVMGQAQAAAAAPHAPVEIQSASPVADPAQLVIAINGRTRAPKTEDLFQGFLCTGDYACTNFKQGQFMPGDRDVQRLSDLIRENSASRDVINLFGFGEGAGLINDLDRARREGMQPIPTVQEVRFRAGDPYNPLTGMRRDRAVNTSHPTVHFAVMGDIVAVFPDRPLSVGGLLYIAEGLSGFGWHHRMGYLDFDLTSNKTLVYFDGNEATYILKDFGKLRSTMWLRPFLGDAVVDAIDARRINLMKKAFDNLDLYEPQTGSATTQEADRSAYRTSATVEADSPSAVPASVSVQFAAPDADVKHQESPRKVHRLAAPIDKIHEAEAPIVESEPDASGDEMLVNEDTEESVEEVRIRDEVDAESDAAQNEDVTKPSPAVAESISQSTDSNESEDPESDAA